MHRRTTSKSPIPAATAQASFPLGKTKLATLFALLGFILSPPPVEASTTASGNQDRSTGQPGLELSGPTLESVPRPAVHNLAPSERETDASDANVSDHLAAETNASYAVATYSALEAEASQLQRQFDHLKNVIRTVTPSVVHIEAVKDSDPNRPGRSIEEAGAGVIFEHAGGHYVLTNRHVIVHAPREKIRLQLVDGRFFHPAKVLTDAGTDVAVLEIDAEDVAPCRIGTSRTLTTGEFVIALGSPFGLNHSASYGIISARGRRDLQLGEEGVRYQDFLQTDAAINPGNSGGPLVDLAGRVIGVNTAIASNSGANEGIGFAIPIDMAMKIAADLIEEGRVSRGFLGVSLDNRFTPETAENMGLNTIYGARIASVTPDSPAESAQFMAGDVILRFDERIVENDSHLVHLVSMTPIGEEVEVEIYRDGKRYQLSTSVDDRRRFDPR